MSTDLPTLRARIEDEDDVLQVVHLIPHGARYLYLIETPFSFPRFAVGTTDAENTDVQILCTCGLLATAAERFNDLREQARPSALVPQPSALLHAA